MQKKLFPSIAFSSVLADSSQTASRSRARQISITCEAFGVALAVRSEPWLERPPTIMKELAEARMREILSLSFAEICELPDYFRETHVVDGKTFNIDTYHDRLSNGNHKIVVQGAQKHAGGMFASVIAIGCEILEGGTARRLREDELYDYT
jgi:hypothetical protein